MNKILGILIAIVIIIAGIFIYKNSTKTPVVTNNTSTTSTTSAQQIVATTTATTTHNVSVKEITVDGKNYSFSPSQITVKKGDTVKITFKDDQGYHNLVVDGYNVKTQTIQGGNTSSVQFVADKAGTFAYYCSVGDHREEGMEGKLVVTQ